MRIVYCPKEMSVLSDIDNVLSKVKRIHMVGNRRLVNVPLLRFFTLRDISFPAPTITKVIFKKESESWGFLYFVGHAENLGTPR